MSRVLDPIPSKLLIECLDSILPYLTYLIKSSLSSGSFQKCFKSGLVTPILKNRCLDHNDSNNYRPVTILCFIAKILEIIVSSHVSFYLDIYKICNSFQSSYHPGLSKDIALLTSVNDLSVLDFLDINSAFDTFAHSIFVNRTILTLELLILCFYGFHL